MVLLASLVIFEAFPGVFDYSDQINKITGMQPLDTTGVAEAMGSVFELIFKGFLGPIDTALGANQLISVKLGLAIILYFLISLAMGERFEKKVTKIISAIISIMFITLIPDNLLEVVFIDFVGGLVSLALLLALIYFPTKGIYNWSKDNLEDRLTQWMCAISQLLLLILIIWVSGKIGSLSTETSSLGDLVVVFGVLISFILIIIYISRAITGATEGAVGKAAEKLEAAGGIKGASKEAIEKAKRLAGFKKTSDFVDSMEAHLNQSRSFYDTNIKGKNKKDLDKKVLRDFLSILKITGATFKGGYKILRASPKPERDLIRQHLNNSLADLTALVRSIGDLNTVLDKLKVSDVKNITDTWNAYLGRAEQYVGEIKKIVKS